MNYNKETISSELQIQQQRNFKNETNKKNLKQEKDRKKTTKIKLKHGNYKYNTRNYIILTTTRQSTGHEIILSNLIKKYIPTISSYLACKNLADSDSVIMLYKVINYPFTII